LSWRNHLSRPARNRYYRRTGSLDVLALMFALLSLTYSVVKVALQLLNQRAERRYGWLPVDVSATKGNTHQRNQPLLMEQKDLQWHS
jgi:hypothetical protein